MHAKHNAHVVVVDDAVGVDIVIGDGVVVWLRSLRASLRCGIRSGVSCLAFRNSRTD